MDLSNQTTGAEEDATVSSLHMDDPMDPIDTVLFADDLSDSVDFLLVFELVDFVLILDTSHLMLFALVILPLPSIIQLSFIVWCCGDR